MASSLVGQNILRKGNACSWSRPSWKYAWLDILVRGVCLSAATHLISTRCFKRGGFRQLERVLRRSLFISWWCTVYLWAFGSLIFFMFSLRAADVSRTEVSWFGWRFSALFFWKKNLSKNSAPIFMRARSVSGLLGRRCLLRQKLLHQAVKNRH